MQQERAKCPHGQQSKFENQRSQWSGPENTYPTAQAAHPHSLSPSLSHNVLPQVTSFTHHSKKEEQHLWKYHSWQLEHIV